MKIFTPRRTSATKIIVIFLIVIFKTNFGIAQNKILFEPNKDSTFFNLTESGASHLASLPLKCLLQEFPNKTNHTSFTNKDHIMLPSALHPSFFGCFDWHSSVHGHWMLVKLLKKIPNMINAAKIRVALNTTITKENILREIDYFNMPLTVSWERTYGWTWLLKLLAEINNWNNEDAKKWALHLKPLDEKIVSLWKKFIPKQTYANRTGVHPNTAFGLTLAFDYASQVKDSSFKNTIVKTSKTLFLNDTKAPTKWEPNGSDFLSPSLEEADLMRRVLTKKEFKAWLNNFLTIDDFYHLSKLPVVSDRADLQIVHLDGLCFNRAWCTNGLLKTLLSNDSKYKMLQAAAFKHLQAALPNVVSGQYGGEHWLASFAVYALLEK